MKKIKKKLSLMIAIVMICSNLLGYAEVPPPEIPVPELKGMGVESTESTEILGYVKGYALLRNSYFDDSQKTTYSRDIARMAALGVIKRDYSSEYRPEIEITQQELIELLVRMSGEENIVLNNVINNANGMGDEAVARLMREEYVNRATALGIITADERLGLIRPATKEQTALWIAKMLGMDPTYQNVNVIYSFDDWKTITPTSRGYIETLLTEKVMDVDNDGQFNGNRAITRGEVAYILNHTADKMYDAMGITSNVGLVIGKKESSVQETNNVIDERRLVVRNMDGTLTTILTKHNKGNNIRNDYVVLLNDIVTDSKRLDVGHQIEYLIRDEQVIYAEVYNDGSIREQIKRESEEGENLNIYYGYINKRISEEKWEKGQYLSIDRLRTTIYTGLVFDLVVEDNLTTGIKNDIIVYKDNKIGGIDLLAENDVVELLVRDEKNIVYVLVKDPTHGQESGTVRFIETDPTTGVTMLTLFDYDDKIKKYEVTNYANITINHELATVDDLRYGQDVLLSITNGYVTNISAETFLNPGFIPDYSKMRFGTISSVNKSGSIKVKYDNGTYKTIKVPDGTTILKGGNIISVFALSAGDKVKLFFNDIYSDSTSLIEVEGKEQLIQNLYRGLVSDVNVYKNEMTIVEPAILNNAQWKNVETFYSKTFKVGEDVGIYVRGEKIDLTTLSKLYKSKPVYIAVRDDYSTEAVVQVSVAVGGEHFASDRVGTIDKALGTFELQDNNRNIVFNEGTIFIKNSKLVDSSSISKLDDVIVVSDYYRGQDSANIVRITSDIEKIFDNIYIGAVENVYGFAFNLRNYAQISGNQWSDVNRSTSAMFSYFNDQHILDVTDKSNFKSLSSYQFYHGGYSRLENKSKNSSGLDYDRYYTYFITDTDRHVIGMNVRQYGLLDGQMLDPILTDEADIKKKLDIKTNNFVLTRGVVANIDTKWKRIEITDSHDWAEDFGRWNANRGNSSVDYRDTIIVKNDKRIEIEDLRQGDDIFLVRDDEDALILIVEVK